MPPHKRLDRRRRILAAFVTFDKVESISKGRFLPVMKKTIANIGNKT
jgi:hypothetical protein